jgi:ABC-type antimicrobial peptide transport system permease subunit
MRLRKVTAGDLRFLAFWFWLLVLVSSVTLLLSLAGIYSVLSFTVSQRTREIGIRVALGGDARRVAAAIFRRPLAQVGVGILLGGSLAAALRSSYTLEGVALVVGYAAFMMAVCMLAAVVPTRRALQVEPMKAMRVDE